MSFKTLFKWCLIAIGAWFFTGTIIGCLGMPSGPWRAISSPNGEKELYLYRPLHRRVLWGVACTIEWPVNMVAVSLASLEGRMFGGGLSLYCSDFSLYVRDISSGRSKMYSVSETGVWSPDSRWIACVGAKNENEQRSLLLIDATAGKEYIISIPNAPRNTSVQNFAWSQDSQMVFFQQEYTVYAYDLDSRKLVAIAHKRKDDEIDVLRIGNEWKGAESGTGSLPGRLLP